MDPMTLLTLGPAVIRTVGKLFGGKTEEVANKVSDVVDAVRGKPDAAARIKSAVDALPAEAQVELKKIGVHAMEIKADLQKAQLEAETARHSESQQTIRTEAQYGTDYVKNTRPRIARLSGYATVAYILVAEAARLITEAWGGSLHGADAVIAGMLFSPCGTYMTMRTVDGFSKFGKG